MDSDFDKDNIAIPSVDEEPSPQVQTNVASERTFRNIFGNKSNVVQSHSSQIASVRLENDFDQGDVPCSIFCDQPEVAPA